MELELKAVVHLDHSADTYHRNSNYGNTRWRQGGSVNCFSIELYHRNSVKGISVTQSTEVVATAVQVHKPTLL